MSDLAPRLSLLLTADRAERTRLAAADADGAFAALADGLARELEPLLDAPLPIPAQKARLTRHGGRCPVHGTYLEFDPWAPHTHRCTRCGRSFHDAAHDDWWAMGAQLWTAERAVHAAALFALRGDTRHGALAARILREYTERYSSWPNRDNVLGPTRPFFSTYLESIWLLNLCHALALLEAAGPAASGVWTAHDASAAREQLLVPSATLIESYFEGGSNRQVWNEVAICSAWRLLGRDDAVRARLSATGGIRWLLAHGLDANGMWYEGENYHLFAHRGLWYGVQLMDAMDEPLDAELTRRFERGFVAPFLGVLPDDTFPSRRDSQYACSVRQWRTAEWAELGWTRSHDARLAAILGRLYDGQAPHGDSGRSRSTADAERNMPPVALTRADLSWRALLTADGALPVAAQMSASSSVLLPTQGLAVLRRDVGRTYVALEGGQLGGGHGHPDQLALTLQTGAARWLEDPGTGSYVEPELHWYRSTLAHAAPAIDGASQAPVAAHLVAFDDRGGLGWVAKRVDGLAPGVSVTRSIIVADGYLVDVLEWESARSQPFTLRIASNAVVVAADHAEGAAPHEPVWQPNERVSSTRPDDPERFRQDLESCRVTGTIALDAEPTFARETAGNAATWRARAWYAASAPAELLRARTPGAPGQGTVQAHWLRVHASTGRIVGVWSWPTASDTRGAVSDVQLQPDAMPCVTLTTRDGTTAAHGRAPHGWHIDLTARHARSSIDLEGLVHPEPANPPRTPEAHLQAAATFNVPQLPESALFVPAGHELPGALTTALGEAHYVRTESGWQDAGAPTARVSFATVGDTFIVDVVTRTGAPAYFDVRGENPLDNEPVATNANGLQWYMAPAAASGAGAETWAVRGLVALTAPDAPPFATVTTPEGAVPLGATPQGAASAPESLQPRIAWRPLPDGWAMRLVWNRATLPLDADGALAFELAINERPVERERRRGQLVLSGGGGFGYLAGDRRPRDRFVRLLPGRADAVATLR